MMDITTFWLWIREDMPVNEFEAWLYENVAILEQEMPHELLMELLQFNYKMYTRHAHAYYELKVKLSVWLEANHPSQCPCIKWRKKFIISMGDDEVSEQLSKFQVLRKRTPWLEMIVCPICQSHWYLGCDTEEDDFLLYRLSALEITSILSSNEWPTCFDKNESLGLIDDDWLKRDSCGNCTSLQEWQEKQINLVNPDS